MITPLLTAQLSPAIGTGEFHLRRRLGRQGGERVRAERRVDLPVGKFDLVMGSRGVLHVGSDDNLVTTLAMVCPFEPVEKQAQLEAGTADEQAEMLLTLLRMGAVGPDTSSGGRAVS